MMPSPTPHHSFSRKISQAIRSFFQPNARIVAVSFLFLVLLGALLLKLPWTSLEREVSWTDAFFTAASASCVTGLTAVDPGTSYNLFGRAIILFLIQIGGLGIMTLSTLFWLSTGHRPGIQSQSLIYETFAPDHKKNLKHIILAVIRLTLIMEALGTCILFLRFSGKMSAMDALGQGLFHSVSAFCNAGFSLFPDNLTGYRDDPVINFTICALIIIGGLGFLTVTELLGSVGKKKWRFSKLGIHSKIVITTTIILLALGTLTFFIVESHNTMAGMPWQNRLLVSFFQSTTLRTAGFNTLDFGMLSSLTLFAAILLMFVGASPGSCGGGIKTTTLASLFLLGIAKLRGREKPEVFYRSLSESTMNKAMSLFLLSLFILVAAIMGLLVTEAGDLPHYENRGLFIQIAFEATSAFGTVGVSMDFTPKLSNAGKWIIILLMFIGRIGPLALAVAVSRQTSPRYSYAEEPIMIG